MMARLALMNGGTNPRRPPSPGSVLTSVTRDFLLFLPSGPNLRAVLSYYSATGNVNAEGDVHINASLEGLGTTFNFLKNPFVALKDLFQNSSPKSRGSSIAPIGAEADTTEEIGATQESEGSINMELELEWNGRGDRSKVLAACTQMLTLHLPEPGYFAAGGIAGMVSRTATAPLDRLKVFLIAQTSPAEVAMDHVKDGAPIKAAKHFGKPLVDAFKELWKAGGIRSLFAGKSLSKSCCMD